MLVDMDNMTGKRLMPPILVPVRWLRMISPSAVYTNAFSLREYQSCCWRHLERRRGVCTPLIRSMNREMGNLNVGNGRNKPLYQDVKPSESLIPSLKKVVLMKYLECCGFVIELYDQLTNDNLSV